MSKNLVIVESPAKAKTIERFLGSDFKVLSSKGHIRDLKKKNFGVDLETFHPEYEIPADKARTVAELRTEAKKADTVWLASDEDREGEAISWHLAEVLKLDPQTARRIVFHEITKPAIEHAIANPRTIDLNLVDAQQARRVLDRLVGFKMSPVLWRKVRPSLSAGRVQSVAVRLVVEREREVQAFQAEASYRITAQFKLHDGTALGATLNERFATHAEAEAFLEMCKDAQFVIKSVTKKPSRRSPAAPFTTSTLQQEAARKLGYPVSLTMRLAQSLYESGHITYMRTDSMNLSSLCIGTAGKFIKENIGEEYHKVRQYSTKSKGAQEAHEAIRPTYIDNEMAGDTPQEKRLYDLIRKRTLACQMADAQLERTTVDIRVIDDAGKPKTEAVFTATGEVVLFDGFLRVYRESTDNDTENDDEGRLLPPMAEGETVERYEVTATQRYSQAPQRYNEASLVHKLEELGIGRPSTYAPTISTIQQREYVTRGEGIGTPREYEVMTLTGPTINTTVQTEQTGSTKGRLVPTDIGVVVNDFLLENFPDILDYHFTAKVEEQFDNVAEGRENWTEMIRSFYNHFEPEVERVMNERTEQRVGERILGEEPGTGAPVSARIGRYGPMIQIGTANEEEKPRFATLRAGQSIQTITLEEALKLFKLPRDLGEFEGKKVVVNEGRFGPYVRHDGKFVSIPKEDDVMEVSLERAIELIEAKRKADTEKLIKTFDEDAELQILNGRWGPYIAYEGKNYRIAKDLREQAHELTYAQAKHIVETTTGTGRGKKTATATKATATKAKAKSATTKKSASKKK